ncbi:MAG: tetratricopeptide repeat protein [Chlorobiaceae bacterium]|nr:tetratricopeptide repeat protein [Chlorobiaceae bacterium]
MDNAQVLLTQALEHHQHGQLAQAQSIYETILVIEPNNAEALHLLGCIAYQKNHFQDAVELINRAISLCPDNAVFHSNQGLSLIALGKPDAAVAGYDRAIKLNPNYAEAFYNRGIAFEKLTLFDAAMESYKRAVAINPDFAEAWNNLGNLLNRLEQFNTAVDSYNRAIAIKPDYAEAWFNRGIALYPLKDFDAAIDSYNQAIAIQPDFAEAFFHRAYTLQELKQFDAAIESYNRTIAIDPYFTDAFFNRANALQELKQFDAAIESYSRTIAIQPYFAEAYSNRGNALQNLKQFDAAIESYDQAIAIKPDFADAFSNRGVALQQLKRFDAAIESYNQAITIRTEGAEAFFLRGNAMLELNMIDAALDSFDHAITLRPDYAEAYSNRAIPLLVLKQFDAAMDSFDRAITINPDYADAYWNKALVMLMTGNYKKGWTLYEWRWKVDGFPSPRRNFTQPLWIGNESIEGKTILLHSEQGLGDTIQFCRYVKLVKDLGARVIVEADASLIGLLSQLDGVAKLVAKGDALPFFDLHCPLLSLPLAFNTTLETIPSSSGYLSADTEKVIEWAQRLGPKTKPRIGLVWNGSITHTNDHNRSVSLLSLTRHLPPGFQYISLQKEVRDTDRPLLDSAANIVHPGDDVTDFNDTAALCELMDLVISIDTSVAHLSAAMGKPTWILLPFLPDWRWLLDRDDSPWYASARLYRQEALGDWHGAFTKVGNDLSNKTW